MTIMKKEVNDDPRQILAILNSFGVVGITPSELKAFMKELKVYRKVKEKIYQQMEEESSLNVLQKQEHVESQEINIYKLTTVQNGTVMHEKEVRKARSEQKEEISDARYNKTNGIKRSTSDLEKYKYLKNNLPQKNRKKVIEQSDGTVQGSVNGSWKAEEAVINSPPRTKSATSCGSFGSKKYRSCQSGSNTKSFIRSQNFIQPKALSRKTGNDPVTLYNKYKRFWDQLSLPGEESHAKLRWAVREKMLG